MHNHTYMYMHTHKPLLYYYLIKVTIQMIFTCIEFEAGPMASSSFMRYSSIVI